MSRLLLPLLLLLMLLRLLLLLLLVLLLWLLVLMLLLPVPCRQGPAHHVNPLRPKPETLKGHMSSMKPWEQQRKKSCRHIAAHQLNA
jgi:hypothetical protein